MRVFIGVGHGGRDAGAVYQPAALMEKEVNLAIALAMKDELEKYGIAVSMSRSTDENDPLAEEIDEANAFNPDVAVEVHTNAGGGSGYEVYRQTSTAFGEQSERLARKIIERVCETGAPIRKPSIKTKLMRDGRDWFGWLRNVRCPAVLCEGFFVDNKIDRDFYKNREKLLGLGRAYARGVLDYFGIKPNPDTGRNVIYRVQAGAFANRENAETYAKMLTNAGYPAIIKEETKNDR